MEKRNLGPGVGRLVIGASGFMLGPVLGLTELGHPGSFLVGFPVGVVCGVGAALSAAGLAGWKRG